MTTTNLAFPRSSAITAPPRHLLVAFIGGVVLHGLASLIYLQSQIPVDEPSLRGALKLTGRMSALVFLALYVLGPAARLGVSAARRLLPLRGPLSVLLAGGQVLHAVLIALLMTRHPDVVLPPLLPVVGGFAGYAATGAIALSAVPRLRRRMGETKAWLVQRYGMFYLLALFGYDLFLKPLAQGRLLHASYWPFALLLLGGFTLGAWPSVRKASRDS